MDEMNREMARTINSKSIAPRLAAVAVSALRVVSKVLHLIGNDTRLVRRLLREEGLRALWLRRLRRRTPYEEFWEI